MRSCIIVICIGSAITFGGGSRMPIDICIAVASVWGVHPYLVAWFCILTRRTSHCAHFFETNIRYRLPDVCLILARRLLLSFFKVRSKDTEVLKDAGSLIEKEECLLYKLSFQQVVM